MIDRGKRNVLGVLVDAVDYDAAVARILDAARARQPLAVSALAVHGVMTGVLDRMHRARLNRLNLVTPDGQPVRWALNLLYRVGLRDRVYGPELTARVCAAVEREGLPIYLYGSRQEVLSKLEENLKTRFPAVAHRGLAAVGVSADQPRGAEGDGSRHSGQWGPNYARRSGMSSSGSLGVRECCAPEHAGPGRRSRV